MNIRSLFVLISFLTFSFLHVYSFEIDKKEQAREYYKDGKYDLAYAEYINILNANDSLFYSQYDSKIKRLYDKYQINEQELENSKQESKILYSSVAILLSILTTVILFYFVIKNKNNKLKKTNDALEESLIILNRSIRSKSILLSNMSHEIRNPLNTLVGFSQLLADKDTTKEMAVQFNEIIKLNANLLVTLLNDVVDLSEFNTDENKYIIEKINAVSLSEKVKEGIDRIKSPTVELVFECKDKDIELMTDVSRLQQVMLNLLGNALKFCPKGKIIFSLEKKDEWAVFSVSDTGKGIPKDKQKDLFQRYGKLNESDKGTGLGLSICKTIMTHLGGDIKVDSDYTQGAKFIFTHPISSDAK